MTFEWDEDKNIINKQKHKISFETALHVWQRMWRGGSIMVKKLVTTKGQKPTLEQLREVEEAKKYPIEFDEDCQELSPDFMKAFKNARIQQNRHKNA